MCHLLLDTLAPPQQEVMFSISPTSMQQTTGPLVPTTLPETPIAASLRSRAHIGYVAARVIVLSPPVVLTVFHLVKILSDVHYVLLGLN